MMMQEFGQVDTGDRPNVPNVAIFITDGPASRDTQYTIPYAQEARQRNITIFGVGITSAVNETEVKLISSEPQEVDKSYFMTPNFHRLASVIDPLLAQVCLLHVTGR